MEYAERMEGSKPVATPSGDTRARIRKVLQDHGQLSAQTGTLQDDSDLYEAGMTSRASVSVMLALEGEFDIEFPDPMLRRDVFQSIEAIGAAVDLLVAKR
jgi:acyl carrier protein